MEHFHGLCVWKLPEKGGANFGAVQIPRHFTLQTERNLKGKGASPNLPFFWSHLQGVEGAALAQLMWEKVAGMGGEKLRDHLCNYQGGCISISKFWSGDRHLVWVYKLQLGWWLLGTCFICGIEISTHLNLERHPGHGLWICKLSWR